MQPSLFLTHPLPPLKRGKDTPTHPKGKGERKREGNEEKKGKGEKGEGRGKTALAGERQAERRRRAPGKIRCLSEASFGSSSEAEARSSEAAEALIFWFLLDQAKRNNPAAAGTGDASERLQFLVELVADGEAIHEIVERQAADLVVAEPIVLQGADVILVRLVLAIGMKRVIVLA